jgi:heterodisulfide reductase subunit A-like polyferredoxin
MEQNSCVIYCSCGAGIANSNYDEISEGLKNLAVHVFELHDLCAFSVNEKDVLNTIGSKYQKKIVVACYPRAVKNMLKQGGIDTEQYFFLNFRVHTPQEILVKLQDEYQILNGEAKYEVMVSQLEVPAWFPVIDESLCSLCGKCARFCLFGVYKYDKKSLEVVNPLACKNNCPACGRTCPTSAIMFPRLDEKTALAGAEPGTRVKKTPDGSLLFMLNDRNRERKSIFRLGVMQQAEEERRKALEEIRTGMLKKNS